MRNTPILIPIILGVCLATMTYLIYAAISTGVDPVLPSVATDRGIVAEDVYLDDIRDEAPEADLAETEEADLDRYFEKPPEAEITRPSSTPLYKKDEDVGEAWKESRVARELEADLAGTYLVLAGSFRQLLNAERQVKKLKQAGFAESEVSRSNNGAYAVAFVGRRASESEARRLVADLKKKGFEGRVIAE